MFEQVRSTADLAPPAAGLGIRHAEEEHGGGEGVLQHGDAAGERAGDRQDTETGRPTATAAGTEDNRRHNQTTQVRLSALPFYITTYSIFKPRSCQAAAGRSEAPWS